MGDAFKRKLLPERTTTDEQGFTTVLTYYYQISVNATLADVDLEQGDLLPEDNDYHIEAAHIEHQDKGAARSARQHAVAVVTVLKYHEWA